MLSVSLPTNPVDSRRRKQISISQRKPHFKPGVSDPYPQMSPTTESVQPDLSTVLELDFLHSYFDDENKQFTMLNHEVSLQLLQRLQTQFDQVLNILPVAPFLIIECDTQVPDPSTTPFLVAGLIACFIIKGEPYPFGINFIGKDGRGFGLTEDDMPISVWNDLKPFHIPQLSTFEWIYKTIPNAKFVSSFPQQLVIELDSMEDKDFQHQLSSLPDTIGSLNVGYLNGTFLKFARHKSPQPCELDGEYDDTDYISLDNGGQMKPGMLLESAGYVDDKGIRQGVVMGNSGIKVRKNDTMRVTVAAHRWDMVEDKVVYHPTRTGHDIGTVVDRIEDIGMVDCSCSYTNELLELQTKAKSLYHSSQLQYNQFVVIDSCFTGVQTLRVLGVRTGTYRRPLVTDAGDLVPGPLQDIQYIQVEQGIYGVNSAVIPRESRIREGVCGTPLIVGGKNKREMARILGDGLVTGFMSWNNIEGQYNINRQIYSFCQTVDPLIELGWSLCNE